VRPSLLFSFYTLKDWWLDSPAGSAGSAGNSGHPGNSGR
jgi:hypothetical protein